MSKKYNVSQNNALPFDLKKGGALVLIIALLILAANALLSERGQPLPSDVVNLAETVVGDSFTPDQPGTETDLPPTRTLKPISTAAPVQSPSESDAMPWADADGDFDYYVLALSWQPAFCETRPDKEECETQTTGRYDATNFVLHGLWPSVKGDNGNSFGYCDVSQAIIRQDDAGDWCAMPALDLSAAVWQDLTMLMPGAASCLHHHEWYKHGTCAGMSPDVYYALTNALVARFAETDFNRYVAGRIGDDVKRSDLLAQFDAEFGPDARDHLSLRCAKVGGVSLLSEIQIALQPDIAEVDDWVELFPDEKTPTQGNCPQTFMVDRVGVGEY